MPLTLILKCKPGAPLEVEGVTPCMVRSKSLDEIEKLGVFEGNRQVPLAEFFSVAGDSADGTVIWEGDLSQVHWIGAKMRGGRMLIRGSAGRHLGSQMVGGEIHVTGNAGDFAGCEMHGGLIHIRDSAGSLAGGAYRGSPCGMSGGTILIAGNAGDEIGHTMRRGLVVVGGSAGDLAGCNMLAGTIVLAGRVGIRHGAGMKRGTIVLAGDRSPALLPSYRRACRFRPEIWPLLCCRLRQLDFQIAEEVVTSSYDLFSGDLLSGGRGEILVRA